MALTTLHSFLMVIAIITEAQSVFAGPNACPMPSSSTSTTYYSNILDLSSTSSSVTSNPSISLEQSITSSIEVVESPGITITISNPQISSSNFFSSSGLSGSSDSSVSAAPILSTSSTTSIPASSTSISSAVPTLPVSLKRGLTYVGNNLFPQDGLIWSREGTPISWYYNYDFTPEGIYNNTLEYVPQLWGDFESNFTDAVLQMKASGLNISYILGFNEPDGPFSEGGSNVTPARAAARWLTDVEPLWNHNIKLGAPAVSGSVRGLTWLANFFSECTGCHIDFIPVHVYGDNGTVGYWVEQHRLIRPGFPLWVTEFADSNVDLDLTLYETISSINWLDSLSYVDRYSYFGFTRSYSSNVGYNTTLLDTCGNLTTLGNYYMNIGGAGNTGVTGSSPGPQQCPSGLQDVGCPWSNGTYYIEPRSDKVFYIECYVDYTGIEVDFYEQTDFTECIQQCATRNHGCEDISWANGPCYAKASIHNPSVNYNVWGARLVVSSISSSLAQQTSSSI